MHAQWEKISVLLFLLIFLDFLAGCSQLNSRTDIKIASISISPKNAAFMTGYHESFVVVKKDENRVEVGIIEKPSLTVTGGIGIITEYFQFYGTKVGTGTVTAAYNDFRDTAEVDVVPGSGCGIYFGEYDSSYVTDDPLKEVYSYFKAEKTINASKLRLFIRQKNEPNSISIRTDIYVAPTSFEPSSANDDTAVASANWTKIGSNIDIVSLFGNTDGWKGIPINSHSFTADKWYLIRFVQTVSANNNEKDDLYQSYSADLNDFAKSASSYFSVGSAMGFTFKTVYVDLE